jgi:hypothetical protein
MSLANKAATAATLTARPSAHKLANAPSTPLSLPRAANRRIPRYSRLATRSGRVRTSSSYAWRKRLVGNRSAK